MSDLLKLKHLSILPQKIVQEILVVGHLGHQVGIANLFSGYAIKSLGSRNYLGQASKLETHIQCFSLIIAFVQGFPFKKKFRGHCDPQVVDFGGHFQFERVTF